MCKKVVFLACVLALMLGYLASLSPANATTIKNCTDSDTLLINSTKTICINNDCEILNLSESITCPFGCSFSELKCKPSPFNQNLLFIGIILIFIIALALILHIKR